MSELNYTDVYNTCVKELREQLNLKTNMEHFKHCFRNLSELDVERLFKTQSASYLGLDFSIVMTVESENCIQRLAEMNAQALMAELS